MNKFFKYGLITAGVSMAIGIVFAIISTAIEGRFILNNSGWFLRRLSNIGILDEIGDFWVATHHGDGHFGFTGNGKAPTGLKINGELQDLMAIQEPGQIAAAGIRNLRLAFGAGQFFIREKDTDDGIIGITVQGVGDCNYYTDSDTFYVESFMGNHYIGEDFSKNQLIIELPKGISFDEVELACGAGIAEIVNLTANELKIEAGAGEVEVNYADVRKLSADIGAGRMETSNMSAQEVRLELGMGECIYHGTILQELDAECGLGNMEIRVQGAMEDYNYEIECSAGNINLGGRSITGLAAEKDIYNGAPATFELSCNMGNISVSFSE